MRAKPNLLLRSAVPPIFTPVRLRDVAISAPGTISAPVATSGLAAISFLRRGSDCDGRSKIPHRNRLTTQIALPNVNVSYIHMRPSMTSAANQDAYGSRGWNQGPWGNTQGPQWHQPNYGPPGGNQGWGNQAWAGPPFWHPAGLSRPAAIAFTVLGFIFWWPVGLALLIYLIGSGRMGCYGPGRRAMKRAMKEQFWREAGPWANWKSWAYRSVQRRGSELRQPCLRRIQGRDPPPHGGGAEGIRCLPRTPALRQGQVGV